MDFLGMGPFEILMVLLVGFLFLGPEKLPGMAAKTGELYRKLTKATLNLAKSLTEEVSAETKATSDLTKSVSSFTEEISTVVSDATKSIAKEISAETKNKESDKTLPPPAADEKASK